MMNNRNAKLTVLLCALFLLAGYSASTAQSNLEAGGLVFSGINLYDDDSDGQQRDDRFSFVILYDIPADYEIYFSDLGWTNNNSFQTVNNAKTDGVIRWKAPAEGLQAGAHIVIDSKYKLTANTGTVSGIQSGENTTEYLNIGLQGDHVFAFTGSVNSPEFIAGASINTSWAGSLQNSTITSSRSQLPAGLQGSAVQNLNLITDDGERFYNSVIASSILSKNPEVAVDDFNNSSRWYFDATAFPLALPGNFILPKTLYSFESQRQMVSNRSETTFNGNAFGLTQTGFSFKLLNTPANGSLTGSGTIPLDQLNSGALKYTAVPNQHGYVYDSFQYRIVDVNGFESSDAFTMTLDLASASVQLKDTEGWRMMTSSALNETFGQFLGPIWTQGIPGSDYAPAVDTPNIYLFDQTLFKWIELSDMGLQTGEGLPFLVYVYSDDDFDRSPDGFPKTLLSNESWNSLEGNYEYTSLGYQSDPSGVNPNNLYLVANPHPISLNFCEFLRSAVADNINVWNPSKNDGDYELLECKNGAVQIAPFQAFWIRTTAANPTLEIPVQAYLKTAEDGYFKESPEKEDLFRIVLTIASEDWEKTFSNRTELYFSEGATATLDAMDAPNLSPAGLAQKWLSFYSLDEENRSYALQALPTAMGEKASIPLDIQTTESGRFILNWDLPADHISKGNFFLRDNQTREVIELREGNSYSFEMDPTQTSKVLKTLEVSGEATHPMSVSAMNEILQSDTHRMNTEVAPRFELVITADGIDGLTELGAVPEVFTLAQNYPNPFNPTTVISYQLPINSEVRLEVYDMLGRNVATLVNGQVSAGRHTVNFDARNLSSGIYLYRLQAGSQIMTRKLTVVK